MDILHIYGPVQWHDDVYIVGNKSALEKMRAAIDKALQEETGEFLSFVNDGEGFDTFIVKLDDQEKLDRLSVPYTDEVAMQSNMENVICPWELDQFKNRTMSPNAEEIINLTQEEIDNMEDFGPDFLWLEKLKVYFENDQKMQDWLNTPNNAFDNKMPKELLADIPKGRQQLRTMMWQLDSGVPS